MREGHAARLHRAVQFFVKARLPAQPFELRATAHDARVGQQNPKDLLACKPAQHFRGFERGVTLSRDHERKLRKARDGFAGESHPPPEQQRLDIFARKTRAHAKPGARPEAHKLVQGDSSCETARPGGHTSSTADSSAAIAAGSSRGVPQSPSTPAAVSSASSPKP